MAVYVTINPELVIYLDETGESLNLEVYVAEELVFDAGYSEETSTDSNYEVVFSEEGVISEETVYFENGSVQEYFYRADGTLQKSTLTLADGWRYECEYYENEILSKSSTYYTTGATSIMEFDEAGNLVSYCEKTYSEDEVPVLLSTKTYSEVDGAITEQYFDSLGKTTEVHSTWSDGRTSDTCYYEDGSGYKVVDNFPDGSYEIHYMNEKGQQVEYYYYDANGVPCEGLEAWNRL